MKIRYVLVQFSMVWPGELVLPPGEDVGVKVDAADRDDCQVTLTLEDGRTLDGDIADPIRKAMMQLW